MQFKMANTTDKCDLAAFKYGNEPITLLFYYDEGVYDFIDSVTAFKNYQLKDKYRSIVIETQVLNIVKLILEKHPDFVDALFDASQLQNSYLLRHEDSLEGSDFYKAFCVAVDKEYHWYDCYRYAINKNSIERIVCFFGLIDILEMLIQDYPDLVTKECIDSTIVGDRADTLDCILRLRPELFSIKRYFYKAHNIIKYLYDKHPDILTQDIMDDVFESVFNEGASILLLKLIEIVPMKHKKIKVDNLFDWDEAHDYCESGPPYLVESKYIEAIRDGFDIVDLEERLQRSKDDKFVVDYLNKFALGG